MKFEIKARAAFDGRVLFTAELDAKYESEPHSIQLGAAVKIAVRAGANLAGANLAGANLARAYLADANLARAYLADAYLAGANLARAYLADAYLAGANLAGANLAGANLARANLAGANLADANLADAITKPASPEEIKRLDEVREIVLSKPERLRMSGWHSEGWAPEHTPEEEHKCGSAHCIAGWLQALSPEKKIRQMQPDAAGRLLCPTFSFMFYTSDAVALQWLKDRAYAKADECKP